MTYDFNILYYISIYKKSRRIIFISVLIAASLAFCFAILSPTTYVSSASLLKMEASGMSSGDSTIARFLGMASSGSTWELVSSIMTSRRMANDIRESFKLDEKPKFWWRLTQDRLYSGIVEVRGSDPELVQKIVDFSIENLNEINQELTITPAKPMVKVLDTATYGSPLPRQILRKVFVAAILGFLAVSLYIFFSDYLNKLKQKKTDI